MNRSRRWLLLVVPVLVVLLSIVLREVRGPYYMGRNADPEYCYLMNGLNIAMLERPGHVDHPGTTLQEFGGLVVALTWQARRLTRDSEETMQVDVLSHPEFYLRTINVSLMALFGLLLWLGGRRVLRISGSMAAALALQGTFLAYYHTIWALPRVATEVMLLVAGALLVLPLAPVVMGANQEDKSRRPWLAVLTGAVMGFAAVTKITWVPLLALIFVFPGWRQRLRFLGGFAGTAAVLLIPVYSELARMADWFVQLTTHTGMYGSGPAGFPDIATYLVRFPTMLLTEPTLVLLLGLYVWLVASYWNRRKGTGAGPWPRTTVLLGCALAGIVMALCAVAKHYAPHYMLSAIVVTPLLNASIVASPRTPHVRSAGRVCVALLVAGLILRIPLSGFWLAEVNDERKIGRAVEAAAVQEGCLTIGSYGTTSQMFALRFGNGFSRQVHTKTLESLYPNRIHYGVFGGGFQSFGGEPRLEAVQDRIRSGGCVLLMGREPMLENSATGFARVPITPLPPDAYETLYRLKAVPSD